jgi:hypothetical protein
MIWVGIGLNKPRIPTYARAHDAWFQADSNRRHGDLRMMMELLIVINLEA